jgi:cellulose synthase (UDP-forming)
MSIPARLTYISGFFYYAYTALLTLAGPIIPIIMLAFRPGQVQLRNFAILLPAMLTGLVLYPLWHRSRYGPAVWPLSLARGWAHVFAIYDGARGKTMSWRPSRTPGSALRRFRIGIIGWSGSVALLWTVLAVWRTVATGSPRFAVLVLFGLLNLAVVARVIFPGTGTA